jgi:hypothetical protein
MARSISDQMVGQGIIREDETPEAKRAARRDAQPVEPPRELPPAFEAPARGVIVESGPSAAPVQRRCTDCGVNLPHTRRGHVRCAECAAGD